jgi:hypothetical protein
MIVPVCSQQILVPIRIMSVLLPRYISKLGIGDRVPSGTDEELTFDDRQQL